jgi:hypothetical protein
MVAAVAIIFAPVRLVGEAPMTVVFTEACAAASSGYFCYSADNYICSTPRDDFMDHRVVFLPHM